MLSLRVSQMLPLENMPILREQEVYRMPSVAIILATLQRRSILEEAVSHASRFPLIDPLDAFYLLNPSGDLSRTQAEFEEWFRLLNLQVCSYWFLLWLKDNQGPTDKVSELYLSVSYKYGRSQ